ncbi:MAG: DUF4928 family protein [Phycisphaerales bacterium]|nr:DUF4928 family protein [Phycisphaerales bacterium]
MAKPADVLANFDRWYQALKPLKQYAGRPAKGTIAAALIVLERLRENCALRLEDHLAEGGAQISGMSLPALRKVLVRFGEKREFPSEGGRTNRGNNKPIRELLGAMTAGGLDQLGLSDRVIAIDKMQQMLVGSLDAYYRLERIRFVFDSRKPAQFMVAEILANAGERQQTGAVAQHLVGAKLAIRFPEKVISNFPYSAADDQGGRSGDFQVGGTAFHVTVAPTKAHAAKCAKNLRDGLAAFLIVDQANVDRARYALEFEKIADRVAVESVESFVGQNLSELAEFTADRIAPTWGCLLQSYNARVSEVETDSSLLIEVPTALVGAAGVGEEE